MGCWNTSFWDNDECVDFLILLFQHMALLPFPRLRISRAYAIEFPGGEFTTFVRHSSEEFDLVQQLLASITKTTLQRAKATDNHFKQKLTKDAASPEMNLIERLRDRMGLTMDHMWTIIHMHVGAPVDNIQELDVLANAFLLFAPPTPALTRGTYKINEYLTNFLGKSNGWIKEQTKLQATAIHAGVMRYKDSMLHSNMQQGINYDNCLESMKLQFWGVQNTIALVRGREGKADLSVPQNVWNVNATAEFEQHGLRHAGIDTTIDDIKCSTCNTPGCLVEEEEEGPPLWSDVPCRPRLVLCSCGCVKYCSEVCQVCTLSLLFLFFLCFAPLLFLLPTFLLLTQDHHFAPQKAHWRDHRRLHKWRQMVLGSSSSCCDDGVLIKMKQDEQHHGTTKDNNKPKKSTTDEVAHSSYEGPN
jgi:hypothetical protein